MLGSLQSCHNAWESRPGELHPEATLPPGTPEFASQAVDSRLGDLARIDNSGGDMGIYPFCISFHLAAEVASNTRLLFIPEMENQPSIDVHGFGPMERRQGC